MSPRLPRRTVVGLAVAIAAAALTAGPALAQERERSKRADETKRSNPAERASGVIVKVEPVAKGDSGSSPGNEAKRNVSRRLTINTAAVWRDWVRDQASENPTGSTRKAAEKGANSVATKGEPQTPDTLVMVDIGPDTAIETRYRASTDETSKGARTPAGARDDDPDPAAKGKGKGKGRSRDAGKAQRLSADDLKPGLFVEVDFRHATAQDIASSVAVIRPVGGPDTPAEK
jgi:hypothetical protein